MSLDDSVVCQDWTHIANPGTHQRHPQLLSPPLLDSTVHASHRTTRRGGPPSADRSRAWRVRPSIAVALVPGRFLPRDEFADQACPLVQPAGSICSKARRSHVRDLARGSWGDLVRGRGRP